jgi:hypothetical protein
VIAAIIAGKRVRVSPCDSHLLQFKWYISHGYVRRGLGTGKQVFLHHAVMGFPLNNLFIDHKNGIKTDCRRENLRIVNVHQNMSNNKKRREGKCTSKFPGVFLNTVKVGKKTYNYWRAMCKISNKNIHIGNFKNEVEASKAYENTIKSEVCI